MLFRSKLFELTSDLNDSIVAAADPYILPDGQWAEQAGVSQFGDIFNFTSEQISYITSGAVADRQGLFAISGAESIAIYFGLSEVIIGLSIIAVGTSLPELAATVAAIRQDKSLIVIGNVLGSNFLNIVVVFPIIAFGSNEVFDGVIFTRDFLIMSVFSALFILALVVGRQKDGLSKILFYGFGLIFILGYLIYLLSLFI